MIRKKIILITILAFVPIFIFAQASGGQIRRNKPVSQTSSRQNNNSLSLKYEQALPFNGGIAAVKLNLNRSLGPISSGDVKVFSCSPESKKCLPLIHGSHKT